MNLHSFICSFALCICSFEMTVNVLVLMKGFLLCRGEIGFFALSRSSYSPLRYWILWLEKAIGPFLLM